MSQDELKKSTEETNSLENLKWLASIAPSMPELSFIEPVAQAMALINTKYTNDEIIIIGTSGFIATKARVVDEERFQKITPSEYFHHAYILFKMMKKEEPSESEYIDLMNKIYK
jgi:hypothetical protein